MESMTGFGAFDGNNKQFQFSIEIKTLNSRYLEINVYLPKLLKSEELKIIEIIKGKFTRGKIDIAIDISGWNQEKKSNLNIQLLKEYYKQLKKVSDELKINHMPVLENLLHLDGVSSKEKTYIEESSLQSIYKGLDKVIKHAQSMRQKEGIATKNDISNSLKEISLNLTQISLLSKKNVKEKYKKLEERINSILSQNIEKVRLYTEIAILTDKIDINEEVVRLKDHINKMKLLMSENLGIGKKIDFLAQEMFREINTIISKANNSGISHIGVDIKNFIDKIREQSKNIA